MNIERYILPVTFAATVHAALLFALPGKTIREMVRVVEVTLAPPPPKPADDPVIPPLEEKTPDTEPVKPLAGGPMPPELEPLPLPPKLTDLGPTEEARRNNPGPVATTIPLTFGPGDTGLPGFADGGLPGVISSHLLDRAPLARVQPSPDYPARMRRDGISGSVVVEFMVNTTGAVVRAEAVSYTHAEFVEPALRAVRHWRFEPGRRANRIVPFRMTVPIEFGIERS